MPTQPGQLVLADLYDYPSVPYTQTHPDRLATLARLAGMTPAPVDRCRVLEVGCGEGANTLGLAYTLPNSTFLGLDLGKNPIDKANAAIEALGLKNVQCICRNLLEFDPGEQQFDYVIAHGFYSWVPQIVRDKLMTLLSRMLAPNGVAYISYNVYPGYYSGKRLRDFTFLHLNAMRAANPGSLESAGDEIRETRRLMQLLHKNAPKDAAPPRADLYHEAGLVLDRRPALIFHDIIADHWDPFTLRQFLAHAESHGLQYLDEALPAEPDLPKVPEPLMDFIRESCGGDRLLELQYIDNVIARRFRRSLLVRKEVRLATEDQADAIAAMYASTRLAEIKTEQDGSVTFEIAEEVTVSSPSPVVIGILRRLIATFPQRVAIRDFEGNDPETNRDLHGLFLKMYRAGSVDLFTQRSPAGAPTGKPLASALVRYQSLRKKELGNLLHHGIEFSDEHAPWFLNLLDGTRDHAALLDECVRRFPDRPRSELAVHLYARLDYMSKFAVLHDQDG